MRVEETEIHLALETEIDLALVARVREFARSGGARAVRELRGVSVSEFARVLGVAPSTVLRWERAQRTPRAAAAMKYQALLERLMEAS
jgi:DNA-binding transcriptional regulator YiaG